MRLAHFITFEGGEGCGKSTQARLLAEWLEATGVPVLLTREPGGTEGAEAIRNLLLRPPDISEWNVQAEALLFAAARADHVAKTIVPALKAGRWVVCDRFVDSSCAYQGVGGGLGLEAVIALHDIGSHGLLPTRTILLDVDETETAARLAERDRGRTDVIASRDNAYHRKVADAFRHLASKETDRFEVIDGSGSPDEVQKLVQTALRPLLAETL